MQMEANDLSEFCSLVERKDLSGFGKILYGAMTAESIKEHCPQDVLQAAEVVQSQWIATLAVGNIIDISPAPFLAWYPAKLLRKEQDEESLFNVHYLGWGKGKDEIVDLTKCRCLPAYTMTKQKKKPSPRPRKSFFYLEPLDDSADPSPATQAVSEDQTLPLPSFLPPAQKEHEHVQENVPEQLTEEKTDMVIKKSKEVKAKDEDKGDYKLKEKDKPKQKENPQKKKTTKNLVEEADWICTECGDMEAPDESDLLLCEGGCKRSFHLLCLGIVSPTEREKLIAGDAWVCNDCRRHRHTCAICHDEGDDETEVIKCGMESCGKYFHYSCLTSQAKHYTIKHKKQIQNASPASGSQLIDDDNEATPSGGWGEYRLVSCPLHFCAVCTDFYRKSDWKDRCTLKKCCRCPRAFHERCIPPDCRYNDLILLCGNHRDERFPPTNFDLSLPTEFPSDSQIVISSSRAASASHLFQSSAFTSRHFGPVFSQLQLPSFFPDPSSSSGTHFRLPTQIRTDIHSLPPSFKMIFTNDYEPFLEANNRISNDHPDVQCCCVKKCDESCLNRVSKIECYEVGSRSLCAVGDKDCGNRQFASRKYVKVQPFKEGEMGWGLRALEDVPEGTLVIEYIGEVISETQMRERMELQRLQCPNDHDFYIMELDPGIFVDGKKKGNLSRFINHSCDPNCELSRWLVKGRTRIGIFALREIACGEPLSYDYQFDTQETDAFKCHCGTAKCRGTMAPRQKVISKENLSRSDRQKLIARGRKREDKSVLQKEEWKRSFTGKNLPGDGVLEIKNGPSRATFEEGREDRVFLVRNVLSGLDFHRRRELLWRRAGRDKDRTKAQVKDEDRGKTRAAAAAAEETDTAEANVKKRKRSTPASR